MANDDAAHGFVPVRHKTGGQIRQGQYSIVKEEATAMARGDPVTLTGTDNNIKECLEAADEQMIGIFAGCHYRDAQGNPVYTDYWIAATATYGDADAVAYVWDDPDIICQIQCDTLAEGDVGARAAWDTGAPSATTRLSGVELVDVDEATTTFGFWGLLQRRIRMGRIMRSGLTQWPKYPS